MSVLKLQWFWKLLPIFIENAVTLKLESKAGSGSMGKASKEKILEEYRTKMLETISTEEVQNIITKKSMPEHSNCVKTLSTHFKESKADKSKEKELKRLFKYTCLLKRSELKSWTNKKRSEGIADSVDIHLDYFFDEKFPEYLKKFPQKNTSDRSVLNCITYFNRVLNKMLKGKKTEAAVKNQKFFSIRNLLDEASEIYYTIKKEDQPDHFKELKSLFTELNSKIVEKKGDISKTSKFIAEIVGKIINPFIDRFDKKCDALIGSLVKAEVSKIFQIGVYLQLIRCRISIFAFSFVNVETSKDIITKNEDDNSEVLIKYACNIFLFPLFNFIDWDKFREPFRDDIINSTYVNSFINSLFEDTITDEALACSHWRLDIKDVVGVLDLKNDTELGTPVEATKGIGASLWNGVKSSSGWIANSVCTIFKSESSADYGKHGPEAVKSELSEALKYLEEREDGLSSDKDFNSEEDMASSEYVKHKIYSLIQQNAILEELVNSKKNHQIVIGKNYSSVATLYYQIRDVYCVILNSPDESRLNKILIYTDGAIKNDFFDDLSDLRKLESAKKVLGNCLAYSLLEMPRFKKAKGKSCIESLSEFIKTYSKKTKGSSGLTDTALFKHTAVFLGLICFVLLIIKAGKGLPDQDDEEENVSPAKNKRRKIRR